MFEEALVILNVILGFAVGGVWIWSVLTLSQYVKEGRSAGVAFTVYWVFNPGWFTSDGQPTFRKERRRFLIVVAAFIAISILTMALIRN